VRLVGEAKEGAPTRAPSERGSAGKRLANEVARLMSVNGWTHEHFPQPWNVATAFDELKSWLWEQLAEWQLRALRGSSRGDRRESKKVAWALANALVDAGEDRTMVRKEPSVGGSEGGAPEDPERCESRDVLVRRLAEGVPFYAGQFALARPRPTGGTRTLLALRSLTRLDARLAELEITLPLGRVRATAAPASAAGGRDGRRESAPEGSSVVSVSTSESENAGEDEAGALLPTPDALPRAAREDGWE
jgi:hypothetical protein